MVPLLWVVPLALYLLSFIICFDHARWYVRPVWAGAAVVALLGGAVNDSQHANTPLSLVQELLLYFAMLFFVCMVCHGELARRKPHPRYLTEFYLLIAAGGALGGLLVAVVAPLVFSSYLEWPIGMAVSGVLALGLLIARSCAAECGWSATSCSCSLSGRCFRCLVYWRFQVGERWTRRAIFSASSPSRSIIAMTRPSDQFLLVHGRITHGCQFADPAKRRWATSYYGEKSAVGQAIRYFQRSGGVRVGRDRPGRRHLGRLRPAGRRIPLLRDQPRSAPHGPPALHLSGRLPRQVGRRAGRRPAVAGGRAAAAVPGSGARCLHAATPFPRTF